MQKKAETLWKIPLFESFHTTCCFTATVCNPRLLINFPTDHYQLSSMCSSIIQIHEKRTEGLFYWTVMLKAKVSVLVGIISAEDNADIGFPLMGNFTNQCFSPLGHINTISIIYEAIYSEVNVVGSKVSLWKLYKTYLLLL